MTPEQKLQTLLLQDVQVSALVANRVRFDMAEESDAMPYVVLIRDETAAMHTMCGVIDNPDVTFDVHCWAERRSTASELGEAVRTAMQAAGMSVVGYEGGFSQEVEASATVLKVVFD